MYSYYHQALACGPTQRSIRSLLFLLFLSFCVSAQGFAWDEPITHCKFIVITLEKCGTHLLTSAIERLLNKTAHHWYVRYRHPDQVIERLDQADNKDWFLQTHSLPTKDLIDLLKKNEYKVVFLIRDPRDQMVSLVHYLESGWEYGPKIDDKHFGPLPFNEKLLEVITGMRYGVSALKDVMGRKLPWIYQSPDFVHIVRFENLVGAEGGGCNELKLLEMRLLAQFLEVNLSDEQIHKRSQNIFGQDPTTFRKGKMGQWKKTFKQVHCNAFKDVFGKELIELGYETDLNW